MAQHSEAPLSSATEDEASKEHPEVIRLEVLNDFASIDEVNEAFNAFAQTHAIADAVRRTFNIAFDDLINNIVSYGYADDAEHRILVDIALEPSARRLEAVISDDGTPFDPFALAAPDLDDELDERRIGGLGIHLVRSMMDEVEYRRDDGKNIVVIRKFLTPDPSDGPAKPTGD